MTHRALTAMLLVAGGCARSEAVPNAEYGSGANPGASASAGSSAPTSSASHAPGGAGPRVACPKTGHWSDCLVLERLEHAGLAPQKNAKIDDLPKLPGQPVLYSVNSSGLAIYLFPDTLSRRRAAATLDAAAFIPPSRDVGMKNEATSIENDNLLALLYSRNEHQRERVSDALTAGPPQP